MEKKVSNAKRIVEYEMTPEEAEVIVEWYREIRDLPKRTQPSVVVQAFMEPLFAVAEQREYGGH